MEDFRVKLKKESEIDFNKTGGGYHAAYDLLRMRLGCRKTYLVYDIYDCYGTTRIHISHPKNGMIRSLDGSMESFDYSMFKKVKS